MDCTKQGHINQIGPVIEMNIITTGSFKMEEILNNSTIYNRKP